MNLATAALRSLIELMQLRSEPPVDLSWFMFLSKARICTCAQAHNTRMNKQVLLKAVMESILRDDARIVAAADYLLWVLDDKALKRTVARCDASLVHRVTDLLGTLDSKKWTDLRRVLQNSTSENPGCLK